jgi:alpha-beta hydrolase superfamily lysophospholipase
MKKLILYVAAMIAALGAQAFKPEMERVKLSDGERVTARMCLPDSGVMKTIVVIVHGSGPNTYINKRQGFDYYDVLAEGFTERGVGFYTYNRRGVDMSGKAPMYDTVDRVKFEKYTPQMDAVDVESHVAAIKRDRRFRDCKILLYGISEGTMIAPLVVERGKVKVDGLLLHGYCNENMYDVMKWQNGGGVIRGFTLVMDRDDDGAISREEYEVPALEQYRAALLQDLPFDIFDVDGNGLWEAGDIGKMRMETIDKNIMDGIAAGDDTWIWDNYFRSTISWFRGHFRLEANKTRMLRLDLPIHIFHGTHDANVPVEGVYDIAERFRVCGKTNLTTHIFKRHNHDLNLEVWLRTKKYPEGLQKIFDTAAAI